MRATLTSGKINVMQQGHNNRAACSPHEH